MLSNISRLNKKNVFTLLKSVIIICSLLIFLPLSLNLNFNEASQAPITRQGVNLIVKNEAHAIGEELIGKTIAEYLIKFLTGDTSSTLSTGGWLGEKLLKGILRAIITAFYLILWVFYSVSYGLAYLSESLLKLVLDPYLTRDALGGFTNVQFVKSAAQTLANLCNMVYLFILIYIAIGTMFDKADTKQLLIKLTVAALLTNFGLVFAGVIIDFTQVIMYTIYTPDKIQAAGFKPGTEILDTIQSKLRVGQGPSWENFWQSIQSFLWTDEIKDLLQSCIELIALILTALAIAVTIAYISLILIVRFFMLWILLILTPVAFLFSVLPQTEKYWKMWFESLTKYAFTGPILVFFLWLGKKMSDNFSDVQALKNIGNNLPNQDELKYVFYAFVAKNMTSIFQMLALVVTLWAGIYIANLFGIKGAPGMDRLINWTKRLGLGSLVMAGRAFKGIKMAGWRGLKHSVGSLDKEERGYRAEAAKFKEKGNDAKFQEMKAKADEVKKIREGREKLMKSYLAFAGFTSPKNIKSAVSKWWKDSNEEYFNYSEDSMKHHFNRFLDETLGRKDADIAIEGENAEKNLYDIKNQINSKADELREKKLKIRDKEDEINTAIAQNQPAQIIEEKEKELAYLNNEETNLEEDIKQQIVTFANRVTEDQNEKNDIMQHLENLAFNYPNIKNRINSSDPNINEAELNNDIDEVLNLIKSKQNIPEVQKLHIFDIFEGKLIEALKNNDSVELRRLFSDFGNELHLMEVNGDITPAETTILWNKIRSIQSKLFIQTPNARGHHYFRQNTFSVKATNEVPLSQFVLKENLIESTGGRISKNLIRQTREIAIKNKKEDLKTPIWAISENEKKIEEADKLHEKQRLALEQLSDMVVSGNKTLIEQTAALRKISGSAKHYSDLIKKLSESYGDVEGAKKFLANRFGEKEAMIAFRTAELDARKIHNLYGIGHVVYDPLTGKSQFTTPEQRKSIIRKAVSGWDSRELNQIHVQSFDNKKDIEMLAKTINWEFLSKNRPFIKGMRDSVAALLKKHSDTILSSIADPVKQQAFENVKNRVDPEPPKEQQNPSASSPSL